MVEVPDAFPAIVPFASEGRGAISRFATLNPVVRVSGGTSGTGLASAASFIFARVGSTSPTDSCWFYPLIPRAIVTIVSNFITVAIGI